MLYEAVDITEQTYRMLKKKRESAKAHRGEFFAEGNEKWFDMLMIQTECSKSLWKNFRIKCHDIVVRK